MPNPDDLSSLDITSLASDISSEISGGKTAEETPSLTNPEEGKSVPALTEGQTAPTVAQLRALPKSWKKDMEPHWQKLDPAVHDYVYEREENVLRGLQQYSEGHNRWNSLLQPYQELLRQNPGIDPVPLLQGLFNSHLQLLQAPAEQKLALANRMLSAYGISLPQQGQGGETVDPRLAQALSEVATLQARLGQLEAGWNNQQQAQQQALLTENLTKVNTFAEKSPHWEEVAPAVLHFLKTGAATSLENAYELACYANPTVRAKIIAEQQATPTPTAGQKARASSFPNLSASGAAKPRPQRKASMDDTIDGVIAKHYGTH